MSNIPQAQTSRRYHDDTTDNCNPLSSVDTTRRAVKGSYTFEEDKIKEEPLSIIINRFENLMRDLNRTPIKISEVPLPKKPSRRKRAKPEDLHQKAEKVKKKEQPNAIQKIEKPREHREIDAGSEYEDLFKQISILKRRKNWRRRI